MGSKCWGAQRAESRIFRLEVYTASRCFVSCPHEDGCHLPYLEPRSSDWALLPPWWPPSLWYTLLVSCLCFSPHQSILHTVARVIILGHGSGLILFLLQKLSRATPLRIKFKLLPWAHEALCDLCPLSSLASLVLCPGFPQPACRASSSPMIHQAPFCRRAFALTVPSVWLFTHTSPFYL